MKNIWREHVEEIPMIKARNEQSNKVGMIYDIDEKPPLIKWIFLAFQHVFAMFGATILVPTLTGFPISVALFASGIGTLIYITITKRKVPVYLGSSFAYIGAITIAVKALDGDVSAAQTGLIMIGIIYVIVAFIVKIIGKGWIDRLLPPIVIGPMIAVIGLGLATNAITNAGFVENGDLSSMFVAIVTFLIAALISTQAKGFFKIIPFLIAILCGYVLSIFFGLVDFSLISDAPWFQIPEFILPFHIDGFKQYNFYFQAETFAILPVAFVTIAEHIGDHSVLGKICGRNFLKDPGIDKTLMGDGIATSVSAFLGGPANTTYGENTGVIGMTRIASVYVIMLAACIAIALAFIGKISAFISSIPVCVLGGMSILLYGVIASNGLRVLIDNKIDFGNQRNLVIASAMLVIGLGGAILPLGEFMTLSGTALSAIVGIILNLVLPNAKKS